MSFSFHSLLFEPEAFYLGLEKTFLMAFTIERIKSFLAKRRLPQFGHEANKDTYSVSLLLFQLCEHDKHFIFYSLFEPEAFHLMFLLIISNSSSTFFNIYLHLLFKIALLLLLAEIKF